MEYYNNILCVTCEELTSGDNPVMKYITLYQNVRRGNIESINRGGGEGNVALYSYSSLPEKYKKRWVERHGEPEKQMREEMIRNIVKKDEKAERFFEEYRYDKNGELVALPEDVKKEYTWNASVLNALMEEFKRLSSSNNKLTGFRRNLWELLLVTSEEWRPVYGHSLPGSVGRLKALINKFRPDNYGVLVSGKYGNSNTLKIEEDGGRYLVALKRSRVPVYTDMEIFEEYNRVALERGWKPLKSPRSLREWFNSPRVEPLWYDAVYGEMKAHQRYDRKHRTILPGRRDSLWYGDGTKLNPTIVMRTEISALQACTRWWMPIVKSCSVITSATTRTISPSTMLSAWLSRRAGTNPTRSCATTRAVIRRTRRWAFSRRSAVSTARQLRIMANLRRLRTFSTASRARY